MKLDEKSSQLQANTTPNPAVKSREPVVGEKSRWASMDLQDVDTEEKHCDSAQKRSLVA
jgi:hypothetical protein